MSASGKLAITLLLAFILCFTSACAGKEAAGSAPLPAASLSGPLPSVPPPPVPVNVSLSDLSLEVGVGLTRQLTAEGGEKLRWQSSDSAVASVGQDGSVRGAGVGECTVTAANEWGKSAQCRVTVKKAIYLTIDDGPMGCAQEILQVLRANHVKATFFVVDTYNLKLTRQIAEEGHCVALHTYSHRYNVCYRSSGGYFADLDLLADKVEGYTGTRPSIIRFPGGSGNAVCDALTMRRLIHGAHDLGYRVFDWTIASGDAYSLATEESVYGHIVGNLGRDSDVVLMHDKKTTAPVLRRLIPVLRSRGYLFETLDHYPEDSLETVCQYTRAGNPDIPADAVTLPESALTLRAGGTEILTATLSPDDSTDFVRWRSASPAVAAVTAEGAVTGVSQGETVITAVTTSGKEASCRVTVLP